MEYATAWHPFYERNHCDARDHVTLENGLVHSAPGHGEDDSTIQCKYTLDVLSPVDNLALIATAEAPGQGMFLCQSQQSDYRHKEAENGSLLNWAISVYKLT